MSSNRFEGVPRRSLIQRFCIFSVTLIRNANSANPTVSQVPINATFMGVVYPAVLLGFGYAIRYHDTVAGYDVVKQRDEVRRNIGLVFQDTTLDGYLTAERNLRFHAELYGVPRALLGERLDALAG